MIPEKIRYNVSAYNSVNNMLNIAYMAGAVINSKLDKQKSEWHFEVQQTNNSRLALPVVVRGREAISVAKGFAEMDGISLKGHVVGRLNKYGRATASLNALIVERPNLMEMPSYSAWHRPGPKMASTDSNEPLFYGTAQRASNKASLAGIVHTAFLEDKDCLVITLRQHKDEALAVPVRIYGRFAKEYSKRIQQHMPITIEGMFRCRVIQLDPDDPDAIAREPYIHAGHVRTPLREDIARMPEWWDPASVGQASVVSDRAVMQMNAIQAKPVVSIASAGIEIETNFEDPAVSDFEGTAVNTIAQGSPIAAQGSANEDQNAEAAVAPKVRKKRSANPENNNDDKGQEKVGKTEEFEIL